MEFPALPSSVKDYAMIIYYAEGDKYYLMDSDAQFRVVTYDGEQCLSIQAGSTYDTYMQYGKIAWLSGLVEFVPNESENESGNVVITHYVLTGATWIWSNQDIYDESANTIYTGSEPVLVEEPEGDGDSGDTGGEDSGAEIKPFCTKSFQVGIAVGLGLHGVSASFKEQIVASYLLANYDPATSILSVCPGEYTDEIYDRPLTGYNPKVSFVDGCLTVEG